MQGFGIEGTTAIAHKQVGSVFLGRDGKVK